MENQGSRSVLGKLGLLSCLYFAQGLPFGFFQQVLPTSMRQQGYSLSTITLGYLLASPWALKFLWAPFFDDPQWAQRIGFADRRVPILWIQGATVLLLLSLSLVGLRLGLWPLLLGVLLSNLLSATQDIATDGYAVALLAKEERGLGNGVQVAGYRVGMIVGGGLLLILLPELGMGGAFALQAGLLFVSSLPLALSVWGSRAAPQVAPQATGESLGYREMVASFLARSEARSWIYYLLLYKAGESMAQGLVRPFLVDLGFSLPHIGWLLGTVGFTMGLLGSLAGGALVNRLGRLGALQLFALIQALTVGGYALASWIHQPVALGLGALPLQITTTSLKGLTITVLCGAEFFGSGLATAALFTAMMDLCRTKQAATDYTFQASVVVISTLLLAALSGPVAQMLGYKGAFALATVLCLALVYETPRRFSAYQKLLPG